MTTPDPTRIGESSATTSQTGAQEANERRSAEQLPADEQLDTRVVMGDRKRNAEWEEVHDAFDTRTAEVDDRATGDPIGPMHETRDRPTGPTSLPQ